MRGNHGGKPRNGPRFGSIPAHAGEPFAHQIIHAYRRVYPRTCGGTQTESVRCRRTEGLSPHMRGNPQSQSRSLRSPGSIPAHAGEPIDHIRPDVLEEVYPRTCGGTVDTWYLALFAMGLSPHMRGNHGDHSERLRYRGSIPAHAGEPRILCSSDRLGGVYPRTCGGTTLAVQSATEIRGLSPHMRGNLAIARWLLHERQVYPRTCGGTGCALPYFMAVQGLSPHMRGNPVAAIAIRPKMRSIPAHAGEPVPDAHSSQR